MENVVSLKGKLTQLELNNAMQKIGALLKEKDANKNGNIATTTTAIEVVDGEQVMDIEILVPTTSGYNVTVKEPTSQADIENMQIDIYVGISPNIL